MVGPARGASVVIAFTVLVLCAPLHAADGVAEFNGTGTAKIVGGNQVSARRRALGRARRDAVIQAVTRTLEAELLAAHTPALRRQIYSRAASFVRTYRVIDESAQSNVFSLTIAATLALKALRKRIEQVTGASGVGAPKANARPRLAIRALAKGCKKSSLAKHIALRVAGTVRAVGFTAIEPVGAVTQQIARREGAGVFVEIGLRCSPAQGVRGLALQSAKASLQIKAVAGVVTIADLTPLSYGVGATRESAERDAAEGAARGARKLVAALLERWPAQTLSADQRVLHLSGVSSYKQHRTICIVLVGKVDGVKSCMPRRLVGSEAWFTVGTRLSAKVLATRLAGQSFGGFGLSLDRVEGQTLRLTVAGPESK